MRALRLTLAATVLCCTTAELLGDQIDWAPDVATAQRRATESNRLVLIHFWADNCPPCRQLETNVFTRESVGQMIADYFVPVKVNAIEQPALAMQYGVDRWPTDVIITPTGQVLRKMVSPQDPRQYVAQTSAVAQSSHGGAGIEQAGFLGERPKFSRPSFSEQSAQPPSAWDTYAQRSATEYSRANGTAPASTPNNEQVGSQQPIDPGLASFRDSINAQVRQANGQGATGQSTTPNGYGQPVSNASAFPSQLQNAAPPQATHRFHQKVQGTPQEIINNFARPAAPTTQGPPQRGPARAQAVPDPSTRMPVQDDPWNASSPTGPSNLNPPAAASVYDQRSEAWQAPPQAAAQQTPAAAAPYQDVSYGDAPGWDAGADSGGNQGYDPADAYTPQQDSPARATAVATDSPAAGLDDRAAESSYYDAPLDTMLRDRDVAPRPGPQPMAARPPQPQHQDWSRSIDTNPVAPATPAATDVSSRPVCLDGFCPVTLANQNSWKKGDRRWGAVHRGRIYLFAGPKQQAEFLSDPDRFSPVLSGVDPVQLTESREAIEGKREHGVFYRNQIYLFSSEASLKQFWSNPERYAGPIRQAMQAGTVDQMLR